MPPFVNFTTKAKDAIRRAHELAIERGQNHVNPLHMLLSLLLQDESMVISLLDKLEVDTEFLVESVTEMIDPAESQTTISASFQMYLTPDLAHSFEVAPKIAEYLKDQFISTEHIFIALIDSSAEIRELLTRFNIFV